MSKFIVYKQPSGKPWFDASLTSYVRDEISYANEKINHGYYKAHDFFKWICSNKAEQALLEGLAELAPLFPLASYYGLDGIWLSPPPSGSGNAVVIVIGNKNGKLRVVGGNYFNQVPNTYKKNVSNDFWGSVDSIKSDLEKTRYISLYLQQNMSDEDNHFARVITEHSNIAHTMPVYIMVIDDDAKKNHFWGMPAIVSGRRPSDLNHEKIWEGTWQKAK